MPAFLPCRLSHLTEELALLFAEPARREFRELARLVESLFHHYAGGQGRRLGELYGPFDPDNETVPPSTSGDPVHELYASLGGLMERANFSAVPKEQLLTRSDREVLGRLDIDPDVDSIEHVAVWVRGRGLKAMSVRPARRLFRLVELEVPTYRRVGVAVRTHEEPWVILKLFKDVPEKDLELLLPTVRVKMKLLDKLKLSGSGSAAAISIWKILRLVYSQMPSLAKFLSVPFKVLALPILAILGMIYGGKTVLDYGKIKSSYVTALAEHLYAITMASNRSVISRLGSMAGGEDTKEVLIAYSLLAHTGEEGVASEPLRARAEAFAWDRYRARIQFDIDDALGKLQELELVWQREDRWVAVPLDAALRKIDAAWDELYHAPDRVGALLQRRRRVRE